MAGRARVRSSVAAFFNGNMGPTDAVMELS